MHDKTIHGKVRRVAHIPTYRNMAADHDYPAGLSIIC